VSVDNFPGSTATTSLTLRKPRKLVPAAGATIAWTLRDDLTDAVLQSGSVAAEANGLIAVNGLVIPKDPQRVRLELLTPNAPRTGDFNGDGFLDEADIARIAKSPADLDGDGLADAADVELLTRYVNRFPCVGDISGDGAVGGDDLALLLSSWGLCPASCAADLNGNGAVGGSDLAILLANWGGCP